MAPPPPPRDLPPAGADDLTASALTLDETEASPQARALERGLIRVSWILQVMAAGLLFYTVWHRFSGQPASVMSFDLMRLGTPGRLSAGLTEALVGVCLLLPWLVWAGALAGMGLMMGAMFFHLFLLGVEVAGDGGELFRIAMATGALCTGVLALRLLATFPEVLSAVLQTLEPFRGGRQEGRNGGARGRADSQAPE